MNKNIQVRVQGKQVKLMVARHGQSLYIGAAGWCEASDADQARFDGCVRVAAVPTRIRGVKVGLTARGRGRDYQVLHMEPSKHNEGFTWLFLGRPEQ